MHPLYSRIVNHIERVFIITRYNVKEMGEWIRLLQAF